ncbi:MAG: amidohydrolase [Spirochaetaceae bacterium]|nr:amidohydrolase [Myxococcales bacterium]MCB9722419.1 amidohydrolase [Spirochaetaceae bacterium]
MSDNSPYTIITSDAHAGASIDTYRDYLDARHQKLFDDWRGSYRNPQKKHIGSKKHKNWDATERIGDMDEEGIAGEIIFPNTVPPFFRTSVLICGNPSQDDYPRWLEGIRAHNRWLVDFCAEYPERRAGIGLVYLNDIDTAIEEVKWIAKQGLRGGILLPHVPDDCTHILPLYAPDYDRLWEVIQDCDLVINHHGGTGSPDYGRWPVSLPIRLHETPFYSIRSYQHLLLSGVFERFPKLKYIVTEAGCAWVPETLARLDATWNRVRSGVAGEFQFNTEAMPPEPPSFYAKRNCFYGASSASPVELRDRDVIGAERVLWGSDYPHYEGTYPYSKLAIRHTFHDVPEAEVRAMLGLNAAELYDFDLQALKPLVERIGIRPDEVLGRPLAESEFPEGALTNAFRR